MYNSQTVPLQRKRMSLQDVTTGKRALFTGLMHTTSTIRDAVDSLPTAGHYHADISSILLCC